MIRIVTAVCLVLAAPLALAKPSRGPDLLQLARQVGLSDSQVARIRKISFATHRALIGIEARLKTARLDLRELMESDKAPAEAKVLALVGKVGRLETEVKKRQVLMMVRVRKTMSAKQWHKLRRLQARHRHLRAPPRPPPPPSRIR